jgi:subfamily B ATP-binding cassette protein MsbA
VTSITQLFSQPLYARLLRQVVPYRAWFAGGIIAMIAFALTEAAIPAILKPLLDGTFVERDEFYITWAPLLLISLFLVRGFMSFTYTMAFAAVSTRIVYDLRRRMFESLLTAPTAYYDNQATGNVISKLTYDATQVTDAATDVLTVLVKDTVTVLGLLIFLFWLDWQLSLSVFVLVPIITGVIIVVGKRLRRLSKSLQGAFGDLTSVLEESVRGQKIIKVYGGQPYEKERLGEAANWVRRLQFKVRTATAASVPVVEFLGSFVLALVIYIGTARASEEQLTVGGFVAFLTALGLLFAPIKRLTRVAEPLQRGLAAAESVFGLIDETPEVNTGQMKPVSGEGLLEFKDVTFRYGSGDRPALEQFSLTLDPRKTTALVGASGSGKTTVANLIPRMYDVTAGQILLDGVEIRDIELNHLRSNIVLVGQDVVLFNDTIGANIAYGEKGAASDEAIREAARQAHALEFIEQLPDGFETQVGENGVRLSGGQRQRLALARALLRDARILILDEATSALDSQSEFAVQQALESIQHQKTLLIIAHRLATVKSADRIVVMREGRIVETGTHDALVERNGYYADLCRMQFSSEAGQSEGS